MHRVPYEVRSLLAKFALVPLADDCIAIMRSPCLQGSENSFKGQESISSVIGPLTHSLEGVVTFMRAVLGERPWELDPILVPMPFNEEAYALRNLELKAGSSAPALSKEKGAKLCFAIEWDDGCVHPHPPITRALKETKEKLEKAGHTGKSCVLCRACGRRHRHVF